jgi:hypothetical protein
VIIISSFDHLHPAMFRLVIYSTLEVRLLSLNLKLENRKGKKKRCAVTFWQPINVYGWPSANGNASCIIHNQVATTL